MTITPANKAGIWMDHFNAHIIEFSTASNAPEPIQVQTVHHEKELHPGTNENMIHNREQDQQADFYKKICAIMKNYDEVLLFGPTDAKTELLNIVKEDHHFDAIKIETKQADKMTENQQRAFVQEHFSQ
jgi:stalled ribosome rescue protein Dom34